MQIIFVWIKVKAKKYVKKLKITYKSYYKMYSQGTHSSRNLRNYKVCKLEI